MPVDSLIVFLLSIRFLVTAEASPFTTALFLNSSFSRLLKDFLTRSRITSAGMVEVVEILLIIDIILLRSASSSLLPICIFFNLFKVSSRVSRFSQPLDSGSSSLQGKKRRMYVIYNIYTYILLKLISLNVLKYNKDGFF